jgi:hypothetical protein
MGNTQQTQSQQPENEPVASPGVSCTPVSGNVSSNRKRKMEVSPDVSLQSTEEEEEEEEEVRIVESSRAHNVDAHINKRKRVEITSTPIVVKEELQVIR